MHKIEYLEWVKRIRKPAQFEIGGSGVISVHIDELPEVRDAIDINDFNLYGYRPLLKQIAEHYDVSPSQVVTAPGTSMANYLAIGAVVGPGDEVLVEQPAYEPLLSVPRLLGAVVRRFERPYEEGFRINLGRLAATISDRTKLIILTNLHNPSGVLESPEVVREVGKIAATVGAYVMVDEVYMDFLFEGRPPSCVHLGSNFLMTCSLTKVYGLDGLRCGWAIASPEVADAMWLLQDFFGNNHAIPAEKASVVAFEHLPRFMERTRAIIARNRPLVEAFMAQHRDVLDWVAPDAGPVCFPRLRQGDGNQFEERLRSEFGVGVMPGRWFEMPDHFRLGMGGKTEDLVEGLDRLGQALVGL